MFITETLQGFIIYSIVLLFSFALFMFEKKKEQLRQKFTVKRKNSVTLIILKLI